ncbi:glycosyltransferase family 4 protein [Neobacillus cucumis]|uniref:glycosyltransferase family 4 protein n=1 Tax=Neobacillus cucumis TaxID=1740721 RepID=UPI0018DF7D9C|nr:glycosyltransferase family 4 protein [Neobacillus cucumis]MBI0577792.1 glycosyltransferase family 4 protein [Neobacillus cucumis]
MKVLICTFWAYPLVGGVTTHIQLLKEGLEKIGHTVDIFSMSDVHRLIKNESSIVNHFVSLLNQNSNISTFIKEYEKDRFLYKMIISKHLNLNIYDVIHVHDVICSSILRHLTNKKIIQTVHGYVSNEAISNQVINRGSIEESYLVSLEKEGIYSADFIITADHKIKNYITETFDYRNEILAMKNFVDISSLDLEKDKYTLRKELGLPENKIICICARRLVKKNGVLYALKAAQKLKYAHPDFLLICFGDGPEMRNSYSYIKENQLQDVCIMLGSVDNSLVKKYTLASDVSIVPSVPSEGVEEATSITALEGMSAGIPVIASDLAGLKELIAHGENGLLIKPFDYEGLADAILSLAKSENLRQKLGRHAKETILNEHCHLKAAKKISALYQLER